MEIISFKKKKSNKYEITFKDGSTIDLYDDVIMFIRGYNDMSWKYLWSRVDMHPKIHDYSNNVSETAMVTIMINFD